MKKFQVIKVSNSFSTDGLRTDVEEKVNSLAEEGFEIISVSFSSDLWRLPVAFITVKK